jgi:ABC-type Mn2+/Zn2+ transport system permease subunit
VAVLARQDLMGHDIGHLLLYAIGLVLTFNMGRDITLLVIYPFVFGWLLLWWNKRRKKAKS